MCSAWPAPAPRAAGGRPAPKLSADAVLPAGGPRAMSQTTERIVAIGTSTGGTQALEEVLTRLPRVCPGMVIVQHMPEKFTAAFADRLDRLCQIRVKEAENNDRVVPGQALIARAAHLLLQRSGAQYRVEVATARWSAATSPRWTCCSARWPRPPGQRAGHHHDRHGRRRRRRPAGMHEAGAHTLAQDEASCVVFGMPKEASSAAA
jgi:two-component system chemotaxis response regulator CheB